MKQSPWRCSRRRPKRSLTVKKILLCETAILEYSQKQPSWDIAAVERNDQHRQCRVFKNQVRACLPLFAIAFLPQKPEDFLGLRHILDLCASQSLSTWFWPSSASLPVPSRLCGARANPAPQLFAGARCYYRLIKSHIHCKVRNVRATRDEKVEYIHLNPVNAGLVKRPEDWKWSSVHDYTGSVNAPFGEGSPIPVDRIQLPGDPKARI